MLNGVTMSHGRVSEMSTPQLSRTLGVGVLTLRLNVITVSVVAILAKARGTLWPRGSSSARSELQEKILPARPGSPLSPALPGRPTPCGPGGPGWPLGPVGPSVPTPSDPLSPLSPLSPAGPRISHCVFQSWLDEDLLFPSHGNQVITFAEGKGVQQLHASLAGLFVQGPPAFPGDL
ncbi:hypothetical protein B566_EDAN002918 [Ephemera danica]|nr:hypothetical protein B566_EDAN002918 [Ephemera danica]